jgi:predicted DNA-binding transcriptional regulator AlpA
MREAVIRVRVDPDQVRQALDEIFHPDDPDNRLVRAGDIVSTIELAAFLGVTRQRITTWISRRGKINFPEPLRAFEGGQYCWDVGEVQQWYTQWLGTRNHLGDR